METVSRTLVKPKISMSAELLKGINFTNDKEQVLKSPLYQVLYSHLLGYKHDY